MSEEVMVAKDMGRAIKDDISNAEALRRRYGINPAEFDDVEQLREAVRERRRQRA